MSIEQTYMLKVALARSYLTFDDSMMMLVSYVRPDKSFKSWSELQHFFFATGSSNQQHSKWKWRYSINKIHSKCDKMMDLWKGAGFDTIEHTPLSVCAAISVFVFRIKALCTQSDLFEC